jgi:phosphoglycolate phosphatase
MPPNLASPVSGRRRYRLIVYDLDGTLFETIPDLRTAANLSFRERNLPEISLEAVRLAIGDGARVLIERLCPPGTDDGEIEAILESFRGHYLRVCLDHTTLREGAFEFVRRRASAPWRLQAILTNKPQDPTDLLVRHHGLRDWIGRALGGDTGLGRKPDPAGLESLLAWAGAGPDQTLVVGDGPADLAVAQAAGVDAVRLDGGYGRPDELDRFPWAWRAGSFAELESLWPRVEPGADAGLPFASAWH